MPRNRTIPRRIKASELSGVRAALFKAQDGCCALCGNEITDPKDICVDHCHRRGFIRAILCRNCNQIEGRIRHYANRAKRNRTVEEWTADLLAYWEKHNKNPSNLYHPSHKTEDEKRLLRNKRARKKRQNEKNKTNKGKVRNRKR